MKDEPVERDPALAEALAPLLDPSGRSTDWEALRRATNARAASELAKRRFRRRMRIALPATAAAGIALFVFVARGPEWGSGQPTSPVVGSEASIDELLGVNVSEGQFRAVLAGADETNELLLIAAAEEPR
jgi:hypothetical protein